MIQSEDIGEFAAAMAKAQSQMTGAKKNSTNPQFRSQYSDLASVIDAAREALTSHGICIVQGIGRYHDGCITVSTRLIHTSGQWIEESMEIPVVAKVINAQALMSASTYGRRYGLMGMVGIAPIDDDDGNAACTGDGSVTLSGDQASLINRLLESTKADQAGILKHFEVASIADMTQAQAAKLIQMLRTKAKSNAG